VASNLLAPPTVPVAVINRYAEFDIRSTHVYMSLTVSCPSPCYQNCAGNFNKGAWPAGGGGSTTCSDLTSQTRYPAAGSSNLIVLAGSSPQAEATPFKCSLSSHSIKALSALEPTSIKKDQCVSRATADASDPSTTRPVLLYINDQELGEVGGPRGVGTIAC
jgi:hypothetical protein